MANSRIGLNWPPLRVMSAKLLFRSFARFQAKHEGVRPRRAFALSSLGLCLYHILCLILPFLSKLTSHHPNQTLLLFQFVTSPICGEELLFVFLVREAGDFLLLFIGPNVGSGCQTEAK